MDLGPSLLIDHASMQRWAVKRIYFPSISNRFVPIKSFDRHASRAKCAYTTANSAFSAPSESNRHAGLQPLPIRNKADDHHQRASRHVLRGILRECTYLPDPFAASYVREHVLARCRKYHLSAWKRRDDPKLPKIMERRRRKGRQTLSQMQRANAGDRKMLVKAISMAHGRVGKRRRELMARMLPAAGTAGDPTAQVPDAQDGGDGDAISPAEDGLAAHLAAKAELASSSHDCVKKQVKRAVDGLPSQLRILVESQIRASPPTTSHRNPKRLTPEIVELNSWHRPMPQVRVLKKLKQWYAHLLSLVQPPLPDEDWYHLRDLATGAVPMVALKTRRSNHVTSPSALESIVQQGKVPEDFFRQDYAHEITPRFMRRVYAEVFAQCPLMQYDASGDSWKVSWGCHVVHLPLKAAGTSIALPDDSASDRAPR